MTFVPDFGKESNPDRHIAFICSKGNLDMAYPALVMGNAALGEGVKTSFFFTFWGMDMIIKSRQDHLMFSPAGNSAMHLPGSDMHFPQSMSLLPGMTANVRVVVESRDAALKIANAALRFRPPGAADVKAADVNAAVAKLPRKPK